MEKFPVIPCCNNVLIVELTLEKGFKETGIRSGQSLNKLCNSGIGSFAMDAIRSINGFDVICLC